MNFVDQLLEKVAAARHLDGPTKAVVTEFVSSQRAVLERLEPALVGAFFEALQGGTPTRAWDLLAGQMSQDELLGLLRQTRTELADLDAARGAATAQFQGFIEALGSTALRLVAGLVLSAL